MQIRNWHLREFLAGLLIAIVLMITSAGCASHHFDAHAADAYDLSEWQGRLSNRQASRLKNEVSFLILRAQNGGRYQDRVFNYNVNRLNQHQIPYGVYSYSLYHDSRSARFEADSLYRRAPQAQFYVNDDEVNRAGRRSNSAAESWAKEMKRLTTRPVVLYSYASFIQYHLNRAKKYYNVIWLANYNHSRPKTNFKYGMWQFTDNYYSRALGKRIDASRLTGTPLTFWINKGGTPVSTAGNQTEVTSQNDYQTGSPRTQESVSRHRRTPSKRVKSVKRVKRHRRHHRHHHFRRWRLSNRYVVHYYRWF